MFVLAQTGPEKLPKAPLKAKCSADTQERRELDATWRQAVGMRWQAGGGVSGRDAGDTSMPKLNLV